MPASPQNFKLQVDQWTAKAREAPMLVVKETIQELNNQIVATSPFKTGYLRGSYFADLNVVPSGTGAVGRPSTAAVNLIALRLKPGDTYTMGNTAKYARRLEYGFVGTDSKGRQYNQMGRYWVRSVLVRFQAISNAAATKVAERLDALAP